MPTVTRIDLNADLGEGYGPWPMGDDPEMLQIVTSANIACGGHAGDAETMFATLTRAKANGVIIGAHPGYADRAGFGRRIIPMSPAEIERMVATQIGALMGAAVLAGASVRYVKAHGALANLAADDASVAGAVARTAAAISHDLVLLAISGTELETAGHAAGLQVFSEVFADRAYLPNGRLVPRSQSGAMIHDADVAAQRLINFLQSGLMPTLDGPSIPLAADSICVHGDSPGAVAMAGHIRKSLTAAGITVAAFLPPK
jgi:5-oxoprolinase (ATP-hydrolysing) subunit A